MGYEKNINKVFITDTKEIENQKKLDKLWDQLSIERKIRVDRVKHLDAKALLIGSELLLKRILMKEYTIKIDNQVEFGEYGKPQLRDYPEMQFNISHSGHYVVCAISNEAIGIDIQKIKEVNIDLAKRYYSDDEISWLLNLPQKDQKLGFYTLWSIKESYMKYTGKGFHLSMKDFSAQMEETVILNSQPRIFEKGEEVNVRLKNYPEINNYSLWCCGNHNNYPISIEWIDLRE